MPRHSQPHTHTNSLHSHATHLHLKMGSRNLTGQERAKILALKEINVPLKENCMHTWKGKTAVYSLISRDKELPSGDIPPHQLVAGCLRKTSSASGKDYCKSVETTLPNHSWWCGSLHTIQHHYQDLRPHLHSTTIKRMLTSKMCAAWLNFARKYFTTEDSQRELWSNESTFQCGAVKHSKLRHPSDMNPFDTITCILIIRLGVSSVVKL